MNCTTYSHNGPTGTTKEISGTTCSGTVGYYYLTYGQSICMDNNKPLINLNGLVIGSECIEATPTPTPYNFSYCYLTSTGQTITPFECPNDGLTYYDTYNQIFFSAVTNDQLTNVHPSMYFTLSNGTDYATVYINEGEYFTEFIYPKVNFQYTNTGCTSTTYPDWNLVSSGYIQCTPTQTPTNTPTPSITPTNTITPSITPTNTPTQSITPTNTPTQTVTPSTTPYICLTGFGFNNRVDITEIDILNPNKIYAAGLFTEYNGITRENITRIYTNGDIDYSWDSGTGLNGNTQIFDIHQLSNGKVLIGGNFSTYRGNTSSRIARINSDGSFDSTFVTTGITGLNSGVNTIGEQSTGKFIVGGSFFVFGQSYTNLCRLNSDGSIDTTFTPPIFTGIGAVQKVIINSDDTIYVATSENGISGETRKNLYLLTSGGTYNSATAFNSSGLGCDTAVYDMEITQTNKLLVVGSFLNYNGVNARRAILLNSDGTKDTTFNNTNGFNQLVYDVIEDANGKYMFCGFFSNYSGTSVNGVIRTSNTGVLDTTFSAGTFNPSGTEARVDLTIDAGGSIYVGGEFISYDGYDVRRFVKLYPNGQINDCDLVPVSPTPTVTPTRTLTPTPSVTQTITPTPSG